MATEALLVLEDGRTFPGFAMGAAGDAIGEVVFNTSMTGYQEILTDPSYRSQLVCMTPPMMGNYGTNAEDHEHGTPMAAGLIVRNACPHPSNYRSSATLSSYLERSGLVGLTEVDTRALTRHLRVRGVMLGAITRRVDAVATVLDEIRAATPYAERDLVGEVSCVAAYRWQEPLTAGFQPSHLRTDQHRGLRIAVLDFGVKHSILRHLINCGCEVDVLPARSSAEDVLARKPDGLLLSNGPGDPAACADIHEQVRQLLGRLPILGICLGHQLIGLALGGRTYKLKFGHRGGNHPVKSHANGRVLITAHNHGYAVDGDSLGAAIRPTFTNLNDGTLEGFEHTAMPLWAIQFHPEAAPGPNDATGVFADFLDAARSLRVPG